MLVASLIIPAQAANNVLYPKDYILYTKYEDNIETISYNFDVSPFLSVKERINGHSYTGFNFVDINGVYSEDTYIFRIYPLGQAFTPGASNNGTLIDIGDFKSRAIIKLTCDLEFYVHIEAQPFASGNSTCYFESTPYVCFYDKDGNFVNWTLADAERKEIVIEDIGNVEQSLQKFPLDVEIPLQIPDGAVYMAPCVLSYFYPPAGDAPHSIGFLRANCNRFIMRADKSILLEQSETLKAVEEQLGDLNDKADTIINGTQEQQQDGQNAVDKAEEQDREFDEIMEQLEDYEKIDTSSIASVIQDFVYTDGWLYIKDLLSPVLNWNPYIVTMLVVLALVNLSVILFGR